MSNYKDFITNRYSGKDVYVVASGPSLYDFDYSKLGDKIVIAVNHAYKLVDADCVVFNDKSFLERECPEVIEHKNCLSRFHKNKPIIPITFSNRFSYNIADGVYTGKSSGAAALTVALQGGASKVYLLGFDYCSMIINDKYYLHSTDDKFNHRHKTNKSEYIFRSVINLFKQFPEDKIINCSNISKLPYFERGEI